MTAGRARKHRGASYPTQLSRGQIRYLAMREKAAQTEPAARLVAVTNAIALHLPRDQARLGQALQKSAARVLLLSLQGVLHRPTAADRARTYIKKSLDILGLLDRMDACDPGMLQKALTLAEKLLAAIPEEATLTSPLPPGRSRSHGRLLSFSPLVETGSHSP